MKIIETVDTKITEDWGVDWSPMEIVRDFLQNFYDENPINAINISIDKDTVTVSAPSVFDYQLLIYMKSTKVGEGKVGQYGEGFKAAVLNVMRNHRCEVLFLMENTQLRFYFVSKKIGGEETRVVYCERSETDSFTEGSILKITQCPQSIIEEFRFGLNCFYYEGNPLFGDKLASAWERDIFIFKSKDSKGYVFYGKILRAYLDIPLVIVCNRVYKRVEAKIKHDRDRKAFNEDVLTMFLKLVFRPLSYNSKNIVLYLKNWWIRGHKVLSAIATSGYRCENMDFPDNYYAKCNYFHQNHNKDIRFLIEQKIEEYERKKYFACPGYMSSLGMKTAYDEVMEEINRTKKTQTQIYTRKPTELEEEAIRHISKCIYELLPALADNFSNARYTIGDSEEVIGELKSQRGYKSNEVYLSKMFFLFPFCDAVATLAHEWNHIYGYDGSRGFSDALTVFISALIQHRDKIDRFEEHWKQYSQKIEQEQTFYDIDQANIIISKLTDKEKNKILKEIPQEELIKLIEKIKT